MEYKFSDKVTFHPWIGEDYGNRNYKGLNVLILGESHYGKKEIEYSDFTKEVIDDQLSDSPEKKHQFFVKIAKLLSDDPLKRIEIAGIRDLYKKIAFYEFVQSSVGDEHFNRPTPEMWENAKTPFIEVVGKLQPDLIICMGENLWLNTPVDNYQMINEFSSEIGNTKVGCYLIDGKKHYIFRINHPSSIGFDLYAWHKVILTGIEIAKADLF